jgi:hypothetical protein
MVKNNSLGVAAENNVNASMHCLLPTAYCQLPTSYTTYFLLPIAYCILIIASCQQHTAYYLLPTTAYC